MRRDTREMDAGAGNKHNPLTAAPATAVTSTMTVTSTLCVYRTHVTADNMSAGVAKVTRETAGPAGGLATWYHVTRSTTVTSTRSVCMTEMHVPTGARVCGVMKGTDSPAPGKRFLTADERRTHVQRALTVWPGLTRRMSVSVRRDIEETETLAVLWCGRATT